MTDVLCVGESLPAAMDDSDLMRVVGLKKSRFYQLKKTGRFDMFRLRDAVATRPWSGVLVQRWLEGGGAPQSQFGLRRARKAS